MANKRCPVRLGLTGGIGSGKSTAGGMFASLGATMIDADQIARAVTGPGGDAMDAIRSTFGAAFVDASGALDRSRMRELAFNQPEARTQLEAIVHPLVTRHSLMQTQQAIAAGSRLIVHDIPLLTESGRWARQLDAVVVVDCPVETQIERVMHRSGLAPDVVQGIIASQATRHARRAVADIVIANGPHNTLPALQAQVRQVAALFGL
ncbi:dephospho-CoA kinase [Acidovorax kalamii]|uniref:Dephospho-CoA kinase n=1 Tax=Acidovorax kalamii TaxID=2004485 RepID=A0A235ERD8_9BURK|nr:dephospho-CoA kinase [Acidovorax kalamii]OYD50975.1 dephospho-CoA kinase [Acidovorax kalamii]